MQQITGEGVALIGLGAHMRYALLPALRTLEVPVPGVLTRHPEQVKPLANACGIPRVFQDLEELRETKSLTAVVICASARAHLELLGQLKGIPCPIFVEKPVGTNSAELERLTGEMRGGPFVQVGFQKRYAPVYSRLKTMMEQGEIVQPACIDYRFQVGQLPPESDFLLDVGIHAFDLMRFLLGELEVVAAVRQQHSGRSHYDILLESVNGCSATLRMGEMGDWHRPSERLEFIGPGHRLVADNLIRVEHERAFQGVAGSPDLTSGTSGYWEANMTLPIPQNHSLSFQGYIGQFEAFFSSSSHGEALSPNLEEALAAMRLIEEVRNRERQRKNGDRHSFSAF